MKISHLKTNRIVNPIGFAITKASFSWIVEDTVDSQQIAAQVWVSLSPDFHAPIFDSGKLSGNVIDSRAYTPEIQLLPRRRYYWKVRVWGESESAESEIAYFETAKMDEAWQAQWISPTWDNNQLHPLLYRSFELPSRAIEARAYICGLGLYHFELNGQKVGAEYFTPYCNAYDQWLQYQTFDITDYLQNSTNRISVMLGNGWYKGRYGANGGAVDFYGDKFALLCEIRIRMEDGEELLIGSDLSWQAQPSPVLESSIFDGESYDARIEKSIALKEACPVQSIDIDMQRLQARRSLAVLINEIIQPIALIQTPAGETVLDMGQNMTGFLRFKCAAPSGTRIHLQFGEVLQDGNFFRDNLRTAKAEYHYIANGESVLVEPYFTFFGFRYVKITGWHGAINLDDFWGCVLYSQMDTIGTIESSNPKVNQLIQNALWGQKGNFLDIPTDCPQRDERLGWTGDIQVFSGTACFNMDSSAFLAKYLYDLEKEQAKNDGMVPHIVPMANLNKGGSSAWGDVATILPWTLYQFYGDRSLLAEQFAIMQAWVDYIHRMDEAAGANRLWTSGFHFGDWLALDASNPISRKGGTPEDFIASAFYCYSSRLVAKAAQVLGKQEEAEYYGRLSAEVKAAIQHEYFTPTGRLAIPTQTGYVLALFMDLVPEQHRERLQADLILRLEKDNLHLRTGFVGTPYLCRVLSNIGANDLAYKLLLNEDYPSWLYAVNLGATTIWERWNSINPDGSISSTKMNSLNHYAYGSIVEWIYRDVCGLNPAVDEKQAAFRHALIAPKPDPSLQWARATYLSAAGLYKSGWQFADNGYLSIEISIPFNASATVRLPQVGTDEIRINGQVLSEGERKNACLEFVLGAGTYKIEYHYDYEPRPAYVPDLV